MARLPNRAKQNPKLRQLELKDGRASLFLEYYLGRTETPVLDEQGNHVLYTSGALKGKPTEPYDPKELIFKIPEYEACDRHLKRWVKAAGINKNITWHCARHSFSVNALDKGANIKTVSELMGHCDISMTEKYLHVLDRQKKAAVESLGPIGFSMD